MVDLSDELKNIRYGALKTKPLLIKVETITTQKRVKL